MLLTPFDFDYRFDYYFETKIGIIISIHNSSIYSSKLLNTNALHTKNRVFNELHKYRVYSSRAHFFPSFSLKSNFSLSLTTGSTTVFSFKSLTMLEQHFNEQVVNLELRVSLLTKYIAGLKWYQFDEKRKAKSKLECDQACLYAAIKINREYLRRQKSLTIMP